MPSFTLNVEFRGLCMFLVTPGTRRVTVAMPDARAHGGGVEFPARKVGAPHVGYLSCELTNIVGEGGSRSIVEEGRTPYEVVRLFDREELRFGVTPGNHETDDHRILVPGFGCFAPGLRPRANIFSTPVPRALLMRTTLEAGQLDSEPGAYELSFENTLAGPDGPDEICRQAYAHVVTWSTRVDAEYVELTFTKWDETTTSTLRLAPTQTEDEVTVRIANFCARNPLGWGGVGVRKIERRRDKDFRWFYQLVETIPGQTPSLDAPDLKLPVPLLDRRLIDDTSRSDRSMDDRATGTRVTEPPYCVPSQMTV